MLSVILAISLFTSSDTMEVKGMNDIYYRVFASNNNIYFQYKTDKSWTTPEQVGNGRYPTIALGPLGGTPWVLWYNRGSYEYAIRRPNGTWKTKPIFYSEERLEEWSVEPSLAMATLKNEQGDLAYAVFSDNYDRIFFVAFDTIRNYGDPPYQVIDEHYPCLAPSISITPEDRLHIVWQRDIDDGKIFYKEAIKVHPDDIRHDKLPNWSDAFCVSYFHIFPTEPASNPSVEAYGEYVYAAWRGPNYDGKFPGDVWRRARCVSNDDPTNWDDPRNMSETYDDESNYPVMFTDFATVWQEQVSDTNWDIYGNIGNYTGQLFETPKSSKYPHIDGYWDPGAPIATFYCHTIWTEEIAHPVYEVRFGRYEWTSGKSAFDHPYYVVEIGDSSPSPYCTQRDGYFGYGQYAIDYGCQKLKYKLSYLHPIYYYDLRAIVYQQEQNNWSQNFDIDSTFSTTITFEPNRPETVWIRLPQESYKNDTKVKHEIKKIFGNRVVLADLRLFQVEELISTNSDGGGPQSADNILIERPILYRSYPNPFKSQTAIRYSLFAENKVSLSIYDISGRLVKTLVNQNQTSDIYSISWNGRDNKGRTVAQGVYFFRLKTDDFSETNRMLLIR
jgi:hypothetical protein